MGGDDGWGNVLCPTWSFDFNQKDNEIQKLKTKTSTTWSNGESKLYCLNTRKIIPQVDFDLQLEKRFKEKETQKYIDNVEKKIKIAQLSFFKTTIMKKTLGEVSTFYREMKFSCPEEEEIVSTVLCDKLPKFSSGMLAKMKKDEVIEQQSSASIQFYTWKKGVSASNSTHNAFSGNKRKGGNKGKKRDDIAPKDNSEEARLERAAAKSIRQEENKKKKEECDKKRENAILRVKEQINILNVANSQDTTSEVVVPETDEERLKREELEAYIEFKRNEIELFRVKVAENSYDKVVDVNKMMPTASGWKTVNTKKNNKEKITTSILLSFLYEKPKEVLEKEVLEKAVEKVVWKKAKKATVMCISVIKGEKCPHTNGKCNFAHTPDELTPKSCANKYCKFVKKNGEKFVNKGNKVCTYLHERETKNNLLNRIGIQVQGLICKQVMVVINIQPRYMTPLGTRVLKPYSSTQAWGEAQ